ncbi:MAG TPA: histidine--tRNA ligase, partial [Gammaproteobacteria bacterium]|nr:histidine--tRNA ligase [Gammaproteobacteria bacterium]
MPEHIKSIRGMRDLLPDDSGQWQHLETLIKQVMHNYGYGEIRTPLLEKTALFSRSIGDVTDIVEKEMYT